MAFHLKVPTNPLNINRILQKSTCKVYIYIYIYIYIYMCVCVCVCKVYVYNLHIDFCNILSIVKGMSDMGTVVQFATEK